MDVEKQAANFGLRSIVIPDSRLVEGIIKIFVKTGAPWDACAEKHSIKVDIKQAGQSCLLHCAAYFTVITANCIFFEGFRKSPLNIDENIEVVGPFDLFGQALYYKILNIASMMRIKIECCFTHEEPRDFQDVKFMITSYASEVRKALGAGILEEEDLYEVLQHEKLGDENVRDK